MAEGNDANGSILERKEASAPILMTDFSVRDALERLKVVAMEDGDEPRKFVRTCMQITEIGDLQIVCESTFTRLASSRFSGRPAQLMATGMANGLCWNRIFPWMVAEIVSVPMRDDLKRELVVRRYQKSGESFRRYITELMLGNRALEACSEIELCQGAVRRMSLDARTSAIIRALPNNFAELFSVAKELDISTAEEEGRPERNIPSQSFSSRGLAAVGAITPKAVIAETRDNDELPRRRNYYPRRCFSCGSTQHLRYQCNARRPKEAEN
jgi:hypothetical protein